MKLRIAHLYPSLMNLYGDRGNVLALQYRAGLRGIEAEITQIEMLDAVKKDYFHVFFFGGGQDAEQDLIYQDFIDIKGDVLRDEIEDGAAFLAVCGGYQLLGRSYEAYGGKQMPGLGVLDMETIAGSCRATGNVVVEASFGAKKATMVGFENHGGRTIPGETFVPLGSIRIGSGNNGQDGTEGALYKNVVGTYLHGPVLPKNHMLADYIIERGLQRFEPDFVLQAADAAPEEKAWKEAYAVAQAEGREKRAKFERGGSSLR